MSAQRTAHQAKNSLNPFPMRLIVSEPPSPVLIFRTEEKRVDLERLDVSVRECCVELPRVPSVAKSSSICRGSEPRTAGLTHPDWTPRPGSAPSAWLFALNNALTP